MRPGLEDGSDAEAMGARERSEGAAKARWGWQDRDEGRRGRDGKIIPLRCGSLRPCQPLSYMRDLVKVHASVISIDKSPVGFLLVDENVHFIEPRLPRRTLEGPQSDQKQSAIAAG